VICACSMGPMCVKLFHNRLPARCQRPERMEGSVLTRAHSPGSGAFLKIRVPTGAPTPPPSLLRALRHVLRPLVRLLLSNHVTHPTLAKLLKEVYVEVALRDFPIEGKAQTDSRITLLTGIHRKDVKQLRGEIGGEHVAPRSVSLGALLVARWTGTPAYLNREGRPRALAWGGGTGKEPTFDGLVSSVSRDIRPRAILDEVASLRVLQNLYGRTVEDLQALRRRGIPFTEVVQHLLTIMEFLGRSPQIFHRAFGLLLVIEFLLLQVAPEACKDIFRNAGNPLFLMFSDIPGGEPEEERLPMELSYHGTHVGVFDGGVG